MTPTPLTGFIIHSRPYQEKRAIYQFFADRAGLIDGVGVRGLPLFVPIELVVSGKNSLKTFKEPLLLSQNTTPIKPLPLQYGGLYLNELLYRLLPKDDPQPALWRLYYETLALFGVGCDEQTMKVGLRRFELGLFEVLGVPTAWTVGVGGFDYDPQNGFVPNQAGEWQGEQIRAMQALCRYLQQDLAGLDFGQISPIVVNDLGRLFRQIIDDLLQYKPLHSRKLWQEHQRLTSQF